MFRKISMALVALALTFAFAASAQAANNNIPGCQNMLRGSYGSDNDVWAQQPPGLPFKYFWGFHWNANGNIDGYVNYGGVWDKRAWCPGNSYYGDNRDSVYQ